jgi:hypothetical protein
MGSLTCLTDPAALVVADASVIISLNATGFAQEIVRALPNRLAVVDVVPAELELAQLAQNRPSVLAKSMP